MCEYNSVMVYSTLLVSRLSPYCKLKTCIPLKCHLYVINISQASLSRYIVIYTVYTMLYKGGKDCLTGLWQLLLLFLIVLCDTQILGETGRVSRVFENGDLRISFQIHQRWTICAEAVTKVCFKCIL